VLPFPVAFTPYLRTQDYPPSSAAPDPSLSFSQPVNLQTLQPSTHSGWRSFVALCIKSVSQLFYNQPLPHSFSKMQGCHPTIPILELVTRHSPPATASKLFQLTHLQMPPPATPYAAHPYKCPGGGGYFLFSDSSTLSLFNPSTRNSFTMRSYEKKPGRG
jgi:hypothetical protein